MYGFYGAYNYSGLVRQVSGFSNVVSVRSVHVVLWTAGFKGGGKPCLKTRETAALRRGIYPISYLLIDVKTITLEAWLTILLLLYLFYVTRDVDASRRLLCVDFCPPIF